jgi:hypothetical protein
MLDASRDGISFEILKEFVVSLGLEEVWNMVASTTEDSE